MKPRVSKVTRSPTQAIQIQPPSQQLVPNDDDTNSKPKKRNKNEAFYRYKKLLEKEKQKKKRRFNYKVQQECEKSSDSSSSEDIEYLRIPSRSSSSCSSLADEDFDNGAINIIARLQSNGISSSSSPPATITTGEHQENDNGNRSRSEDDDDDDSNLPQISISGNIFEEPEDGNGNETDRCEVDTSEEFESIHDEIEETHNDNNHTVENPEIHNDYNHTVENPAILEAAQIYDDVANFTNSTLPTTNVSNKNGNEYHLQIMAADVEDNEEDDDKDHDWKNCPIYYMDDLNIGAEVEIKSTTITINKFEDEYQQLYNKLISDSVNNGLSTPNNGGNIGKSKVTPKPANDFLGFFVNARDWGWAFSPEDINNAEPFNDDISDSDSTEQDDKPDIKEDFPLNPSPDIETTENSIITAVAAPPQTPIPTPSDDQTTAGFNKEFKEHFMKNVQKMERSRRAKLTYEKFLQRGIASANNANIKLPENWIQILAQDYDFDAYYIGRVLKNRPSSEKVPENSKINTAKTAIKGVPVSAPAATPIILNPNSESFKSFKTHLMDNISTMRSSTKSLMTPSQFISKAKTTAINQNINFSSLPMNWAQLLSIEYNFNDYGIGHLANYPESPAYRRRIAIQKKEWAAFELRKKSSRGFQLC